MPKLDSDLKDFTIEEGAKLKIKTYSTVFSYRYYSRFLYY